MTAAERARWLAELSQALDEAQAALWSIAGREVNDSEIWDVAARVESARAEVRSLRLGVEDRGRREDHPEWMIPSLWDHPEAGAS